MAYQAALSPIPIIKSSYKGYRPHNLPAKMRGGLLFPDFDDASPVKSNTHVITIGRVNKNKLHPMHPMHPYICPVKSTNVAACSISSAFRSHRDLILKQGTTTGKCAAAPWL